MGSRLQGYQKRSTRSPGRDSQLRGRSSSSSRSTNRSRTPSQTSYRSNSQEKQVCRAFLKGKCKRGSECKFLHRPRSKFPNPPTKKIQATCRKLGKCKKREKCIFLDKDLSKPPNTGKEGKPDTPAGPATEDKPDKPRSLAPPGQRRKSSRGPSPNKEKTAACCMLAAAAPSKGVTVRHFWEVDFRAGAVTRHHKCYGTSIFVPTHEDCPMTLSRREGSSSSSLHFGCRVELAGFLGFRKSNHPVGWKDCVQGHAGISGSPSGKACVF